LLKKETFGTEEEFLKARLKKKVINPDYAHYTFVKIKQEVISFINEGHNDASITIEDIHLSITPKHIDGDITLDIFHIGKKLSVNPIKMCMDLSEKINLKDSRYFVSVVPVKGYLNFFLKKDILITSLSEEILTLKNKYGVSNRYEGKVAIVDYSGPNIAKPIGVGHLRSTIIGQALSNLYECVGYTTLRINHIGDWGTQFGALIYAYENWKNEESFKKDPINELKSLYVKFHKHKEDNPDLDEEARKRFSLLESKNAYEYNLWKRFRQLSIDSFEKIYNIFNIRFDAYQGESFYTDKIQTAIDQVKEKKLCIRQEGSKALIVQDLAGLPTFLLQKEDGASLYITRDLAALIYRGNTFTPDTVLYVVGNEQSLHFSQLFTLYNSLGDHSINTLQHIGFGLILTDGKKMSTRKGTLIELNELIQKAIDKVKEILHEKNTLLDEASIKKIAIGSIIYNDLSRSRTKDIDFNWKTMLSMENGSSIYLQYTYARIGSILRKLKERYDSLVNTITIRSDTINEDDISLYLHMLFFLNTIENACESKMPNNISNYLEFLAQEFNTYYSKHSIKDSEDTVFFMRYQMLQCINHIFHNGLKLLNIDTVEKM
jgi:arginyl-tRNA synthetase